MQRSFCLLNSDSRKHHLLEDSDLEGDNYYKQDLETLLPYFVMEYTIRRSAYKSVIIANGYCIEEESNQVRKYLSFPLLEKEGIIQRILHGKGNIIQRKYQSAYLKEIYFTKKANDEIMK